MKNPFELATDGKSYGIISGYVVDVKDNGNRNILLFRKDTTDKSSDLVAVAAWALAEGQTGPDLYGMTKDLKGRFVVCVVNIREKTFEGKKYRNFDLKFLIKMPRQDSLKPA